MNIDEAFQSPFLKASEVGEEGTTFTITSVKMDTVGQGKDAEDKPIVSFKETDKKLVLNKTNAGSVAKLHGPDTDGWSGKKVTLVAREVQFGDEMVWGIRVKGTLNKLTPSTPPPRRDESAGEESPF